jgi:acetyltransferase-like isoleucine patch superfamily enzyme
MFNRIFYLLRSKLLNKERIELYLNFKFLMSSKLAVLRGKLFYVRGYVLNSGIKRPFLVGSDVDALVLDKASIYLEGENYLYEKEYPRNMFFPTASSIGFVPHWSHLNPPTYNKTYLRLQANSKLKMGPNTLICKGSYISIWPNQELFLEGNNYIGHNSYINTRTGLKIGRNTTMGHSVTIMDYDGHPILFPGQSGNADSYGGKSDPIIIGSNVWIGACSTILKGVKIGNGSIIGSKACVVKDVPPNCIVAGNPAKVIRENVTWKLF